MNNGFFVSAVTRCDFIRQIVEIRLSNERLLGRNAKPLPSGYVHGEKTAFGIFDVDVIRQRVNQGAQQIAFRRQFRRALLHPRFQVIARLPQRCCRLFTLAVYVMQRAGDPRSQRGKYHDVGHGKERNAKFSRVKACQLTAQAQPTHKDRKQDCHRQQPPRQQAARAVAHQNRQEPLFRVRTQHAQAQHDKRDGGMQRNRRIGADTIERLDAV